MVTWTKVVYEESARMPFVISYPNEIPKNNRIDDLVTNVDIPSLILDYAGIEKPESFQGSSFRNAILNENKEKKSTYIIDTGNMMLKDQLT